MRTFRYLACNGSNQVFNIFIYWFSFHILLNELDTLVLVKHGVNDFYLNVRASRASYLIASFFTIPIGFLLSKYVVFQESNLKGRVQLFRYGVLTSICFLLNYPLLNLFNDKLGIFPTVAQTLTIVVLAVFSYTIQRFFTFKVKPVQSEIPFAEGSK